MFDALLIEKTGDGTRVQRQSIDETRLPEGDVTVDVAYSTINYKDALAITGRGPIVRRFPMVPGIDFAGVVTESRHADFAVGEPVLLNGWGVGESHWGGLGGRARVPGDWLIRIPAGLTARDAMAIGTAGYTAMLSVLALAKHGVVAGDGEVIVTGANGGVGSTAVALLAARGYRVVASTGRPQIADALRALGAADVIDRATLAAPGKPLGAERWAGAVDCVGSHTLANICATTRYGGVVTACGLAQGMDLPATVAPFILRAVSLIGIDSVRAPRAARVEAWDRLASELPRRYFDDMVSVIGLDAVVETAAELLAGRVQGRVLVDLHR